MKFDPQKHYRQSIRLSHYNYAQSGAYFITICTYQKQCWFGEVKNGQMQLNQIGKIVVKEWLKSSQIRQEIDLDQWVLMPNHLHGIVWINQQIEDLQRVQDLPKVEGARRSQGARHAPLRQENVQNMSQKPRSLSSFIAGFKSSVTRQINLICQTSNFPIWQRNYYESIIRDERHLNNIRQYILDNPHNWDNDPENNQNNLEYKEIMLDLPF